nr:hypothetical protein [Tanacetum cinerariifolium]
KVGNGSSDGIIAIANKLDSLGQYMKMLMENVHVIQVGCKTCRGAHLDKECPFHKDVEQLTKDYQAKAANEVPNSSIGQCKVIYDNDEAPRDETSYNGTNKLHRVSFITNDNVQVSMKMDEGTSGALPYQLPPN